MSALALITLFRAQLIKCCCPHRPIKTVFTDMTIGQHDTDKFSPKVILGCVRLTVKPTITSIQQKRN